VIKVMVYVRGFGWLSEIMLFRIQLDGLNVRSLELVRDNSLSHTRHTSTKMNCDSEGFDIV